jgi:hypothetical protein
MLALKIFLLFSSGGTGGDDNPPSGSEGGESVAVTSRGMGFFHEMLLRVEVSLGIRLTYFKEGSHHPIDFKKELTHVST